MSEVTPHVEKCPTCGHVRVNLTGPPPGPTRPEPNDAEKFRRFLEDNEWQDEVGFGPGWPVSTVSLRFNESGRFIGFGTTIGRTDG